MTASCGFHIISTDNHHRDGYKKSSMLRETTAIALKLSVRMN